jgi:deoxyribonucleoside regulator
MKEPDVRLLTRIAVMYYRDELTHREIAARLGMSRQKVGRYLQAARDEGLIDIQIKSPLLYAAELEARLESKFGLKEAVVVSPAWEGEDAVKEALGMAGAEFLERHVQPGDILGVSWGSTVLEVARHLRPMSREDITVLQLNGSMDVGSVSTRAPYTVELVARAFGAQMITLSAPMMVDRPEILESLLSDSQIAAALSLAQESTVALFGVGDVSERSSPFKVGYYNDQLLSQLRADGAVGEIVGRFYDSQGRPCSPELQRRTLAVDLENLKQKRLSIAIAGLTYKKDAILAMLRGKFCNALITDEATAQALGGDPGKQKSV